MKKYILVISFLLGCFTAVKAQDDGGGDDNKRQEKIRALYVAYITQELKLTPEEAQQFWPLHAQYENEVRGVKPELPELDRQQAVLNIKKRYQDKFVRILNNERCERFFRMDGEFKRKLLERIKNQRQNQNQRPKPRRGF